MSHNTNINRNECEEREIHISTAVDRAIANLREIHSKGSEVCDVAYITGAMRESAKEFNEQKGINNAYF